MSALRLQDLSPDQKAAYATVEDWAKHNELSKPILTLGGFAGSGKSELLGLFAREQASNQSLFARIPVKPLRF